MQALEQEECFEYEQRGVYEMVVVELMRLKIPGICACYEGLPNFRIDVELSAVTHMLVLMQHWTVELAYEASPV